MTLFSVAWKNVKRNFYSYFLYLVSMVFSIMIYYMFTSLKYNQQVLNLANVKEEIKIGFTMASTVIALFAAIFIWYSNSFFTRKRKKEVGLYSLMGVKKRQIGAMLFYENLLMGLCALIIGILLGNIFSKLSVMLLLKLMGFTVNVKFVLIPRAILDTVITFAILFVITSIHGYMIIYRYKLIDLFQADQQGEKEPRASIISAILGVLLIGSGYFYYVTAKIYSLHSLLYTLITVVVGTYFLFSSVTIYLIKMSRKNKKRYYSGVNMIGTSHLLYRIKRHARTLATIAVLSATTITAMGICFSFYYDFQTKFDSQHPFSYVYRVPDKSVDQRMEEIFARHPENEITDSLEIDFIQTKGRFSVKSGFKADRETYVNLISQSKYNQLVAVTKEMEPVTLTGSDEAMIVDEFFSAALDESYIGKTVDLSLPGESKSLTFVDYRTRPLVNSYMLFNIIVISDELFAEVTGGEVIKMKAVIVKDEKRSEGLSKELEGLVTELREGGTYESLGFSSYYLERSDGLIANGLVIFIGTFLGLVFLLSTGSIIFFKQLSEASDDVSRYRILKNIGINRREVRVTISRQLFFVFALPLGVGVVHSLVALSMLNKLLDTNLLVPVTVTVAVYSLIYGVYYYLTVNSYTRIVNSSV